MGLQYRRPSDFTWLYASLGEGQLSPGLLWAEVWVGEVQGWVRRIPKRQLYLEA